jgi:hypothetical protein
MLVQRACSPQPLLVRTSFLVRLIAIVFAGATVWFVWHPERPVPDRIIVVNPEASSAAPRPPAAAVQAVNVVDVAALAASPALVSQLVRIGDGERITAVDDRAVEGTLEAGALIAERFSRITSRARARLADASVLHGSGGEYIDLNVRGPAGTRRVLVLFH